MLFIDGIEVFTTLATAWQALANKVARPCQYDGKGLPSRWQKEGNLLLAYLLTVLLYCKVTICLVIQYNDTLILVCKANLHA